MRQIRNLFSNQIHYRIKTNKTIQFRSLGVSSRNVTSQVKPLDRKLQTGQGGGSVPDVERRDVPPPHTHTHSALPSGIYGESKVTQLRQNLGWREGADKTRVATGVGGGRRSQAMQTRLLGKLKLSGVVCFKVTGM